MGIREEGLIVLALGNQAGADAAVKGIQQKNAPG
jgi:hypothetical protein